MKVLRFIWLTGAAAYYNRACAHDPTHPDLPYVLRKRSEVAEALQGLWA